MSSNETAVPLVVLRKLPNSWKKANLVCQIVLVLIGAVNVILTSLSDGSGNVIPVKYFEIMSCFLSLAPVVWSKILDQVKIYIEVSDDSHTLTESQNTITRKTVIKQIQFNDDASEDDKYPSKEKINSQLVKNNCINQCSLEKEYTINDNDYIEEEKHIMV